MSDATLPLVDALKIVAESNLQTSRAGYQAGRLAFANDVMDVVHKELAVAMAGKQSLHDVLLAVTDLCRAEATKESSNV